MQTILIVIHLLVVLAMVAVVLLQRSEGGGLGIGGGGGGNFAAARGSGNPLTRATGILAAIFFATSLGLSLLARYGEQPTDFLDRIPTQQQGQQAPSGSGGVLDQLGGDDIPTAPAAPSAPSSDDGAASGAPAAPATDEAPAASATDTDAAPVEQDQVPTGN
ncbi:preprotein translocase subunit SecG [Mesorhizobium sp. YIM 152430]|uniref:preprotein translocase subunit SecG n=1 Tax=Mesorhizobium sp. YIM 152430 TaxID=3031761 RepID=UPI0023DBF1AB|nr:preprotein translocase subunit SecG [Mesorhizobium sp. YIM 152430]MDF1599948.1 preprotein translocase subunit SecG [Mesorhizobium sp. YIM 152430]